MHYEFLTTNEALADFCRSHADTEWIAFDTEFVSEHSYRPELCLIQVAAGEELAIIDPLAVSELTPFWKWLAQPGHATVVHAGREEFRFCVSAIQQRPHGWFDVQLAAAFVGLEYPTSYSNLISRVLGKVLPKGETRTDWRRRPLTRRQLEYAVHDVAYLAPARDALAERMAQLGRREWYEDEQAQWQADIESSLGRPSWRRMPGLSGLSNRQLAIIRELYDWRDATAEQQDSPPRRILRDDLLIELARRQSAEISQIRALRGLEFRHLQKHLPAISSAIQKALDLNERDWPRIERGRGRGSPQLTLLSQFLSCALSSICRSMDLAPGIVGTVDDIRELVAHRLQLPEASDRPPALGTGWRAEVIGKVVDDLLAGRLAMRIDEPLSDRPLVLERIQPGDDPCRRSASP